MQRERKREREGEMRKRRGEHERGEVCGKNDDRNRRCNVIVSFPDLSPLSFLK